jgi:2-iminobutanoate/2-iminopropanoate deaminase
MYITPVLLLNFQFCLSKFKNKIMKKSIKILVLLVLTTNVLFAQAKKESKLKKREINPWSWQDGRNYVQAVEVKNVTGTLYCSGQTAIDSSGKSSTGDMRSQLILTLQNVEKLINDAGYEIKNIVRLNIYTTSEEELFTCFDILQNWTIKHKLRQATTLFEVKSLFETLKIELEATVVK